MLLHHAIIGLTGSGKTFYAQSLARVHRRAGTDTLVLHKEREPWPGDAVSWQTSDPEAMLRVFWRSKSCAVFLELADAEVGKYDERFHRCFSMGRHEGHRCYYLAQRGEQTHPTIRDNCSMLALFACTGRAARAWADEFNAAELLGAASLDPARHNFFLKTRGPSPARLLLLAP